MYMQLVIVWSFSQTRISNRVLPNAVLSNGKFNVNADSPDILEVQKVDGSTLVDSLYLSFINCW